MSAPSNTQQSRQHFDSQMIEAIEAFGIRETLELIEFYLDRHKREDKIELAEHHPAFPILMRTDQVAIHRDTDRRALRRYMHRMLRLLCKVYGVKIPYERDRDAWPAAIDAVRAATSQNRLWAVVKDTAQADEGVDDGRPKPKKRKLAAA